VRLSLEEFSSISLVVEENRLKEPPNHLVTPTFGHNVGRIEFAGQMVETNELGGNSFMNTVKGESIVVLAWHVEWLSYPQQSCYHQTCSSSHG
jgi:hypothetical protein